MQWEWEYQKNKDIFFKIWDPKARGEAIANVSFSKTSSDFKAQTRRSGELFLAHILFVMPKLESTAALLVP